MSGNATRKLNEAAEAFMDDFEGARYTLMRVAEIQAKMSQCMEECLTEISTLLPAPRQQALPPTNEQPLTGTHYDR